MKRLLYEILYKEIKRLVCKSEWHLNGVAAMTSAVIRGC